MRREAEEFLNLVRDAEDPTRADEVRVQRALRAAIAAGAATSVAAHTGFDGAWLREALSRLGLSGGKLNLLAVGAALTLAGGDTPLPPGGTRAEAKPATTSSTPAQTPAPPSGDSAAAVSPDTAPAPRAQGLDVERAAPRRARQRPPTPALERAKPRPRGGAPRVAEDASSSEASSLRAELDLLQRVQAALKRGDGASALRELAAHRTADSTLLAERRAARILALCQLGRITEAQRAAAVFAEQHPDSLQRAAIDSSCANR